MEGMEVQASNILHMSDSVSTHRIVVKKTDIELSRAPRTPKEEGFARSEANWERIHF